MLYGATMAKTIRLAAQTAATIYRRNWSSVPATIHFDAIAIDGGAPMGQVEVRGSHWIFPKPVTTHPLKTKNTVQAGFWDTFFAIHVTAHTGIEVTVPEQSFSLRPWLIGAIALIALAAGLFAVMAQ
jgi:hypothetical protein